MHGASGVDLGSQTVVDIQGATDSSNQCVTSLPGLLTVGSADGSTGSCSANVVSLPEPGCEEMNRIDGSSCPMACWST